MRFRCPMCATWQSLPEDRCADGAEHTCPQCGALLVLAAEPSTDGSHWQASPREERQATSPGEDPLLALLEAADGGESSGRAEELTGLRAQLVAMTFAASVRLWLPAAALVALGLLLGVGMLVVGQRVERALALLLAPFALGLLAFSMVLAASAVAKGVHLTRSGHAVGIGRSLRMIAEHGNGALGSALRFVSLGALGATMCGLLALLGAFPGLGGGGGLALTGALLIFQLLAVGAALWILGLMAVALLIHPGLAATGSAPAGKIFRFVLTLLSREARDLFRRAALPLGTAVAMILAGAWLLRAALGAAISLNTRILGAPFNDLISSSPIRVIYGMPELLDPPLALTVGGLAMAVSLALAASLVLGYVASFLGVSGYLLARGMGLPDRLRGPR